MKSSGVRANDLSRDAALADERPSVRVDDYLEMFLVLLMLASALFALSMLLPDPTAEAVQGFLCFSLTGSTGLLALLAMFRAAQDLFND